MSAFSNQAYEMLSAEVLVDNELLATCDWLKEMFSHLQARAKSSHVTKVRV